MSRSPHLFVAGLTLVASLVAAQTAAQAADLRGPDPLPPIAPVLAPDATPFFVKLGVGALILSEKASITAAGAPLPGANIKVKAQTTAILEVGYNVTPAWAISLTTGLPPVAKVDGAGLIQPYGRLANVRYGPMALTAQYHFDFGAFRPYVGAGPAMLLVLKNHDRALSNFEMRNAVGFAGQVGADFMITDRFGVFVDAKKIYLRTSAVGNLGAAPVKGKVTLDPLVLTTGVVARF